MADLGSDAAGSALSLSAKIIEAIIKLFDKLFDPQRKKYKLELKQLKAEEERNKIIQHLNGKTGFVNYQELRRSGMELVPLNTYMTKDEMRELSALCKREGVIFSGMTDDIERDTDGRKCYRLVIKKEDAEGMLHAIDRLNEERIIRANENRIQEIKDKAETEERDLTPQEQVDIAECERQINAVKQKACTDLNNEVRDGIFNKSVNGEIGKTITLGEALNQRTGRALDKDVETIVADADHPDRYIKCHGYRAQYNGKDYTKTEYEVYRDGKKVFETHDGRFDGRPEHYWESQKAAMMEAGGFSGAFFKFYTVAEYQRWAEKARAENAQELTVTDNKTLEAQLDRNGAKLQDGVVVDKETGQPLVLRDDMAPEERALVAESIVIGKQIDNNQKVAQLETELNLAKVAVSVAEPETPEYAEAEAKLTDVQSRYDAAKAEAQELLTARKEINGAQAEQEVRNMPEEVKTKEIEFLPEDKAKIEALETKIQEATEQNLPEETISQLNDELVQLKDQAVSNALGAQHPDDRRGERVEEQEDRHLDDKADTMAGYEKGILDKKAAVVASQTADVQDRQTQDLGSKAAAVLKKPVSSHEDR